MDLCRRSSDSTDYSNDHRPVHMIGAEPVIDLSCSAGPVELRENYGFSRREIRHITGVLTDHLMNCAWHGREFMASRDDFEQATQRAKDLQARFPRAVSAHYDRGARRIVIHLSSNLIVSFLPGDVEGLELARPSQLREIEISPSGFGIHFPAVDADIYLPGLLEGFLGSEAWMASRLGQIGGRSKSKAKKAASIANGRLGGRPRKTAER